jgi:hypothetical protein
MNAQKQEWRKRARSHYENISELLRERAEQGLGVKGSELYAHPDLYGRSPRNRISELKKNGWNVGGKAAGDGDWFYWLRADNTGRTYPTLRFDEPEKSPRPKLVSQPPLKEPSLFDVKPAQVKSWDEIVRERDQKLRQPGPEFEFELRP